MAQLKTRVLFLTVFVSNFFPAFSQDSNSSNPLRREDGQFVEVKIESGWIRGRINSVQNREIVSFLGVPFAKPPTGQFRFAAPRSPADSWDGAKDMLEFGPDCHSLRDFTFPGFSGSEMWNGAGAFSEDCLHLNIWVPRRAKNAAVLVWIFGGGFVSGSPSLDLYNGGVLSAEGDVVVININYRLGPLGFMYLGEDTANLGLLDQQTALQWISRNVHLFGGDPKQVTLFGESAGAASVSAHLFAPDSWPLFRYAIMQSGGITCPWATRTLRQARRVSDRFLAQIGCSVGGDLDRLNCARRMSADEFLAAYENFSNTATFMDFQFSPVEEDSKFFSGNVKRLLEKGQFKKTAVVVGTNADEGTFWLPYYLSAYFNNTSESLITRDEYWRSVDTAFSDLYYYPPVIRKAIAYQYGSDNGDSWCPSKTAYRRAISNIVGDFIFTCETLDLADILTKHGSVVYGYFFNERSTVNAWPKWMGVMHGYEIEYIFGVPLRKQKEYTPQEIEFSRQIMNYWVSFAKHGEPQKLGQNGKAFSRFHRDMLDHRHPRQATSMPQWPIYGPERRYLILQSAPLKGNESWVDRRSDQDNCGFWRETKQMCQLEFASGMSGNGNLGWRKTNSGGRCTNHWFFAYFSVIIFLFLCLT